MTASQPTAEPPKPCPKKRVRTRIAKRKTLDCLAKLQADRREMIRRFLPCFFDLPVSEAQELLAVSHHTLDPVRRGLGLVRWPFADVSRDRFCMSAAEIAELRERMIPLAEGAMKVSLQKASERAKDVRQFLDLQAEIRLLHFRKKRERDPLLQVKLTAELDQLLSAHRPGAQPDEVPVTKPEEEPEIPKPKQEEQEELESLKLEPTERPEWLLPGDTQFWHEVSTILLHEPAVKQEGSS